MVINRRREIRRCDRAVLDAGSVVFAGSDDLTVTEAAAGHAHRHDHWPVVAAVGAALRAHVRRPSELAHRDDQALVQKASFVQVADERCEKMIESRQQRFEAL